MESKSRLKAILNDDEKMFKLETGFKFALISMVFILMAVGFTYIILKIDLIFLESHGYALEEMFHEAFYEFVLGNIIDQLPLVFIFFIIIFFSGYYIANIMMRPFKLIAKHCEEHLNSETRFYDPDYLSDLKLLTSFSSYFFAKIDEAKIKGKLDKIEIPEDYTKIHKPIIEKNFFFNYSLLIIIFALLASLGIYSLNNDTREKVIHFSNKIAKNNNQVKQFLERQEEVESKVITGLLTIHMFINIMFGIHLYSKISSPAFAIFATMRSFLKGNYHNRVHLIGFYYLRDDCRKINKYLDYVQKNLT